MLRSYEHSAALRYEITLYLHAVDSSRIIYQMGMWKIQSRFRPNPFNIIIIIQHFLTPGMNNEMGPSISLGSSSSASPYLSPHYRDIQPNIIPCNLCCYNNYVCSVKQPNIWDEIYFHKICV